jgi:hypothetical protein
MGTSGMLFIVVFYFVMNPAVAGIRGSWKAIREALVYLYRLLPLGLESGEIVYSADSSMPRKPLLASPKSGTSTFNDHCGIVGLEGQVPIESPTASSPEPQALVGPGTTSLYHHSMVDL